MLFNGEQVGDGTGPDCDVAVDPIDGTRLTANGMPNAIAVIAVSARGLDVRPDRGVLHVQARRRPEAADVVDIDAPPAANIAAVARAKHCYAARRDRGDPGPGAAHRAHLAGPGRRRAGSS